MYLYNSATGKKEEFKPIDPQHVKVYACGPTVYDYFHIGNARAFVVFDTLRRVLEKKYPQVTYVQNVTDIDDKIIKRAQQEGQSCQNLARTYTEAFFEDVQKLGCRPATHVPLATEHIPDIIELIKQMEEKGHAYQQDGNVFFAVRSFPGYGRIARRNIDELESGARIDVNEQKQDPLDFALWKKAKPGEPSWPSPWGDGRPGWHIECSAMSMKYLGPTFDIHGGGEDLIFPHHENENAQSESVTGQPLANYWLHNGYLKINGEKMSKSLGNFKIVREILQHYPYQVLRLFMLSAHYRSPLDFNQDNLNAAQAGYQELSRTVNRLAALEQQAVEPDQQLNEQAQELQAHLTAISSKFDQALDDDLNTAGAIGQLYSLANKIKQLLAGRPKKSYALFQSLKQGQAKLLAMLDVLGIVPDLQLASADILALIDQRNQARAEKEWSRADQLRDEIQQKGYLLEDTNFGALAIRN